MIVDHSKDKVMLLAAMGHLFKISSDSESFDPDSLENLYWNKSELRNRVCVTLMSHLWRVNAQCKPKIPEKATYLRKTCKVQIWTYISVHPHKICDGVNELVDEEWCESPPYVCSESCPYIL